MRRAKRADFDALIGDVEDDNPGTTPIGQNIGEELGLRTADVHTVIGGVSIPWLMKVFGISRAVAEKKLVGLRPVATGKHSTPLYDIPSAAARLVKPTNDLGKLLINMKPADMPERLREAFWNAKLKQQRYEERAGNLWRTEKVLMLVGEFLQEFKQKSTIIPDEAERTLGLSREQQKGLTEMMDSLQKELYEWLLALETGRATPNQLGEDEQDEKEEDLI